MEARTHWIPYIVVVGDKELAGEELSVTIREGSEVGKDRTEKMTLSELVEHIKERTGGFPFRPIYLPARMSLRPIFAG
jgi:threonyl-tRNA synthetase